MRTMSPVVLGPEELTANGSVRISGITFPLPSGSMGGKLLLAGMTCATGAPPKSISVMRNVRGRPDARDVEAVRDVDRPELPDRAVAGRARRARGDEVRRAEDVPGRVLELEEDLRIERPILDVVGHDVDDVAFPESLFHRRGAWIDRRPDGDHRAVEEDVRL